MSSNLLVANDILSGFFAINGGAFSGKAGNVFYCVPDSGKWEDTQLGYSQFLYWALCGEISKFYELYHWDDWREDVKNFSLDRMIFVLLPILWQGVDIKLRLKDMKKDDICMNEFFIFAFKGRLVNLYDTSSRSKSFALSYLKFIKFFHNLLKSVYKNNSEY